MIPLLKFILALSVFLEQLHKNNSICTNVVILLLLLFFRRLHGLRRGHVLARRAGGRSRGRRVAAVHDRGLGDQRKKN